MSKLDDLYAFTDRQGAMVHEKHPGWPCRKGCSALDGHNCCGTSFFPVSSTEWEKLKASLARWGRQRKKALRLRARESYDRYEMHLCAGDYRDFFRKHHAAPVPCPLLDSDNTCSVYADDAHPLVCHAFGHFTDDTEPKWCSAVSAFVHANNVTHAPSWQVLTGRMARTLKGPVKPLIGWLVEDPTW